MTIQDLKRALKELRWTPIRRKQASELLSEIWALESELTAAKQSADTLERRNHDLVVLMNAIEGVKLTHDRQHFYERVDSAFAIHSYRVETGRTEVLSLTMYFKEQP